MQVINIIVTEPACPIVSVDSFGIVDEQLSSEVVDQASELFKEKCIILKYGGSEMQEGFEKEIDDYREDLDESLDDGYEDVAEHTVSIVWSDIYNVQI